MTAEPYPTPATPSPGLAATLDHIDAIVRRRAILDTALEEAVDAALAAIGREHRGWQWDTLLAVYDRLRGKPRAAATRCAKAMEVTTTVLSQWRREGGPPGVRVPQTTGSFPLFHQLLPEDGAPCVYLLENQGVVVYVGYSSHVKRRLRRHWETHQIRCDSWRLVVCETKEAALALEADLIYQHQPEANVVGRRSRLYRRAS